MTRLRLCAIFSRINGQNGVNCVYKMYKRNQMTNIKRRILSGVILAPLFIASMFQTWVFAVVMCSVAVVMLLEWYDMAKSEMDYLFFGLPIVTIPIASLICVRFLDGGEYIVLSYFLIIWAIDIFAMLGGKIIGGAKLAPVVSPKKTWCGLISGALASAIALSLLSSIFPELSPPMSGFSLACFGFIFGLIEQCSDLFISSFKRKFDIKDSGVIIPGHGGVLDRFDGIILTAPILLYYII